MDIPPKVDEGLLSHDDNLVPPGSNWDQPNPCLE